MVRRTGLTLAGVMANFLQTKNRAAQEILRSTGMERGSKGLACEKGMLGPEKSKKMYHGYL